MIIIRRLSLLLVIAFALLSCGSDKEHYRFPLDIGSTWTYRYNYSYYDTNTQQMELYTEIFDMVADSYSTSPDGEQCIRLKAHYADQPLGQYDYTYVVNRPDGFYELGYDCNYFFVPIKGTNQPFPHNPFHPFVKDDTEGPLWYSEPRLMMPFEFEEGTTWNNTNIDGEYSMSYTILPKEHITVPAGNVYAVKRKCDVIGQDTFNWSYLNYFSSTGPVKFYFETMADYFGEAGNLIGRYLTTESMELVSFNHK